MRVGLNTGVDEDIALWGLVSKPAKLSCFAGLKLLRLYHKWSSLLWWPIANKLRITKILDGVWLPFSAFMQCPNSLINFGFLSEKENWVQKFGHKKPNLWLINIFEILKTAMHSSSFKTFVPGSIFF